MIKLASVVLEIVLKVMGFFGVNAATRKKLDDAGREAIDEQAGELAGGSNVRDNERRAREKLKEKKL